MITSKEIVIEQPAGTYKSFEIENNPVWKDYPLSGVIYPVDYGYIKGYTSEDNDDLDIFVGSGALCGYIKIWRCDVPLETKIIYKVTPGEYDTIIKTFKSVIKEKRVFENKTLFNAFFKAYKR
ncbi:hypothetical protein EXS73_01865 [Candidatus Pacearchaeota archaeon]|nr:hypothetical protein [Candidatus Pacearchaeota archaeon]